MHNCRVLAVATVVFLLLSSRFNGLNATTFTDRTSWETALGGFFLTEDFNDSVLNDGVSFESTESGHVNPAGGYYQDVLASQSQNEPTTTWTFVPDIVAYGGVWTLGGPGGSGNSLLVYIADSSEFVGAISNSFGGEFWGFISDSPFSSVKLIGGSGLHQQNYQLDDMVYAPVVPIPGDFDKDGDVDGADFLVWQRGESPATLSSADLADWQANYGEGEVPASIAVPEPTCVLLLLVGLVASTSHTRK